MSNRVLACLDELAPREEQYSIDEMFLDIRGIDNCIDFETFGMQQREHVLPVPTYHRRGYGTD